MVQHLAERRQPLLESGDCQHCPLLPPAGNAVEGFFAKLTRRRLKHGAFHSVVDLQAAINRFVRDYNADDPKPFVWKADPESIIAARNRGFQTLKSIH